LSGGTSNTFIGRWAGNKNEDGNKSVFIGTSSGYGNVHRSYNTFVGEDSGYNNQSDNNTFIGYRSGNSNTTGGANTFVGRDSGYHNTYGFDNIFVGRSSGYSNTDGYGNTFVGDESGYSNTTGNYNTFIGDGAGMHAAADIERSVFLGFEAGDWATRSNTLYIANSDTKTPLIYGEFDTRLVKIHGDLNTTGPVSAAFHGATDKSALKMMDISVNNTNTDKKSDVGFLMTNAREGFGWTFRTWEPDQGFAIAKYGNGGTKELRLYDATPNDPTTVVLALANGASCDGTWNDASSRSLKQDIEPLSSREALEAFERLQPMKYAYKANP